MTHDDAPAVGRVMRDELREKLRHLTRDSGPLGSAVCALLNAAEAELPVMVMPYESRAILDLLARQEAQAEGVSLSAQLSQAAAWMRVWDECQRLGMDTYGAPSTSTGLDIVLDFIRGRAAPQEAREPDGWVIEMRDGSFSQVFADRGKAEKQLQAARSMFRDDGIRLRPVYLGAPAPASGEPSGAEAAVREALDAIKKAHTAVDDLCNGRLIDDALTKAERVIRSLTDGRE